MKCCDFMGVGQTKDGCAGSCYANRCSCTVTLMYCMPLVGHLDEASWLVTYFIPVCTPRSSHTSQCADWHLCSSTLQDSPLWRTAMHATNTVTFDQLMIASSSLRVLTVLKSGQI